MTTTADAKAAPPAVTADTAKLHWVITLQKGSPGRYSAGTVADASTFARPATRGQVFTWAIGNAARKLAETDPAFEHGPYVVLFFSLEPDKLPGQETP